MAGDIAWNVAQTEPVGPQVYRALRDLIIRGALKPGAFISETEIARSFSVSRQPVREAFIRLGEAGLVEIRPQRGTMVRKISLSAVLDARFVREAVEADIVRLAAITSDRSLVNELRSLVATQAEVAESKPDQFLSLDEDFHRTLAASAQKLEAWSIVNSVKAQVDRVRRLSMMSGAIVGRIIDQHTSIIDAVAAGDADAAEAAMRFHLKQILRDMPEIARARAEYFEGAEVHFKAA